MEQQALQTLEAIRQGLTDLQSTLTVSAAICLVLALGLLLRRSKEGGITIVPLATCGLPKAYRLGQIVRGYEVVRIEKLRDGYYQVWGRPLGGRRQAYERGRR